MGTRMLSSALRLRKTSVSQAQEERWTRSFKLTVHTRIAALPTRLPLSLQRLSFFISPSYWISAQLLMSSDQQHRLRPSVPKNSPYKQLSAGETPASPDDPAARRQASQTHLPFPWVQRVCRGAALESEREKMRKRKREVRDWRVRV